MLVIEGLVGLIELLNFSLFSVIGQGRALDYCNIELFALEMNRDHSVVFEIASTYCILDSFVDYDGYSISSKQNTKAKAIPSCGWDSARLDAIIKKQPPKTPNQIYPHSTFLWQGPP